MSTYPYWLLTFSLRADLDPAVIEVLQAVADDREPSAADLNRLPEVPRAHLRAGLRGTASEFSPLAGTPIRLWTRWDGRVGMTVEFSMHDDEYAGEGWQLWLWILSLVDRPSAAAGRSVIGLHGMYHNDYDTSLIHVDADGITEGSTTMSFADLDVAVADLTAAGP